MSPSSPRAPCGLRPKPLQRRVLGLVRNQMFALRCAAVRAALSGAPKGQQGLSSALRGRGFMSDVARGLQASIAAQGDCVYGLHM